MAPKHPKNTAHASRGRADCARGASLKLLEKYMNSELPRETLSRLQARTTAPPAQLFHLSPLSNVDFLSFFGNFFEFTIFAQHFIRASDTTYHPTNRPLLE
jgi:hypothetical protein